MSTTLRFTTAEYDRMLAEGIFDEGRHQRIELIYGELREMSPPGPTHDYVIDLLNAWSFQNIPINEVWVRVQNSIGIASLDSIPQPDMAWVRKKSYRYQRPEPDDVLLVVEVSDTTLDYDRGLKAQLYAEAGFADYWLVDIPDSRLEVRRDPQGGTYRDVRTLEINETVRPLSFPELELPVSLLFEG